MNEWSDWLIVVIFAAGIVVLLVVTILNARARLREKRGESVCIFCKALASRISQKPYLFLIPVFFGEFYEDEENYLRTHMKPIGGTEQIPTGMRACYVEVYHCPRCDKRHVVVKDFLRVRGEDYTKRVYRFPYESFRPLLDGWEQDNGGRPFDNRIAAKDKMLG